MDFIIDQTLGRDVKFQMDYNVTDVSDITEIKITSSAGTTSYPFEPDTTSPIQIFVIDLGDKDVINSYARFQFST